MKSVKCIFIFRFLMLSLSLVESKATEGHRIRSFPEGFVFGTATASYQIEGGWDADGEYSIIKNILF